MIQFVPTICPYCAIGCGMFLAVKDQHVVGVKPNPDHPVSKGKLCAKGWNAHQFIHHEERLRAPLIRGGGLLRQTSWDEVISLITSSFQKIKNKNGSNSIALLSSAKCTNEENYLAQKFTRVVLGTNNIDNCARLCHAPTIAGLSAAFGSGAMTNSITDIEQADCIFVIGSDTTSQHPLIATRIINAKEKGAKIIVADPRRIQLSSIADIFLQQRPGSDVALINGMMKVIMDNGLENKNFIKQKTEGFEQLFEVLKNYSPGRVSEMTGVPPNSIIEAAQTYAKAETSNIIYAMGITQHTTGTDNVKAVADLALLTGNIGKPGSAVNPLRGQNNVQGACDMGALPNVLPDYQLVTNEVTRAKIEEIWRVSSLPDKVGLTSVEMIDAALDKKLKAMYIIGENPLLSEPDINHVKQALESLEFLVVQDIFLTETAKLAHVVLPAACWAEKEGTFTTTDRRVQKIKKAVEPPGESKTDWEIICKLAKIMGARNLFLFTSANEIFEEIRKITPSYMGMTYVRIDQLAGLQWPCPNEDHPGTPILHSVQFTRGRAKFHAVEYKGPAEIQDEEYPYLLTTGRVETQWHTGSMTRRSSTLNDENPEPNVEINPEDAQELQLMNGKEVEIRSKQGKVKIKALITDKVMKGHIFIPFHYAEAAANVLTSSLLDPVAKIPGLKVCPVAIKKPNHLCE